MARWLDRMSCDLADQILLDTQSHIDYFSSELGVPSKKMNWVWVGSDERSFFPRPQTSSEIEVLFIGSFVPLQGTEVILQAAALLDQSCPAIKFQFIGSGEKLPQAKKFAEQHNLVNVCFDPPVPLSDLPDKIAAATICLGGHFGSSAKASRVIAGKTFHCLAMGKAIIVGDNSANHEALNS